MAKQPGKMEIVVDLQQLGTYYKGKRVFITGHTGFKGAWLMALLHVLEAQIKGYALPPEHENGLFQLLQSPGICESIIADIRDKARLEKEIIAFQPDYIFHLAAQPLVRRSYEIPAETFDINVTGTANVLEVLTRLNKKCIAVIITTDKVYQNHEQDIAYKEDDVLGGYDPYSASKACAELVVNAFRNSFFNPVNLDVHQKRIVSARAGNVIGGGDWSQDRIVPDLVRSLKDSKEIHVRNPQAIRPWQHVLEPLCGYLLLGALLNDYRNSYSNTYNFGPLPGDHLTVKQLVESVLKEWRGGIWKDVSDPHQPHEAGLLKLDIAKAKAELGWSPKLNASAAIQWTVEWYRQPLSHQLPFTFRQINKYLAL